MSNDDCIGTTYLPSDSEQRLLNTMATLSAEHDTLRAEVERLKFSNETLVREGDKYIKELRAEVAALTEKYLDLIMQVACKFPGESRHDTAKRYIVERESREVAGPDAALSADKPQHSVTDSIDSPQEPL